MSDIEAMDTTTSLIDPPGEERWNDLLEMVETDDGNEPHHKPIWTPGVKRMADTIVAERKATCRLMKHHLSPCSKILLTGAPGTGKTTLSQSLARRLGMRLLKLRADRIISSRLGGTQRNITLIFDLLRQERSHPQLLLLDEADMLLASRTRHEQDVGEMRRTTNTLLQAIDSWNPVHMLIAATNLPALIDPAATRRFDLTITMPTTDTKTAKRIIGHWLAELDLTLNAKDVTALAAHATGLAPAPIITMLDAQARTGIIHDKPIDTTALADGYEKLQGKE